MTPEDSIRPKWLTVAQLKRVLAEIPDDHQLIANAVGNLGVYKSIDVPLRDEFVGFIDFLHEGNYERSCDGN